MTRPPTTADERFARQIEVEIEAGRRRHGESLEPTKALAAMYKVSAGTVGRGVAILTEKGLIVSTARSRRVVNYPATADGGATSAAPRVLLVGGFAGSGKTELGRIIAQRTHWPMLDKDSTTRPVVEAALTAIGLDPHDRASDTYRTLIRPAEYEALLMGMEENLECGTSCIVTAPFVAEFSNPAWCERTQSLIAKHGGTAHFVWVDTDADTMHFYVRKRGAARDKAKLDNWNAWIDSIDLDFRPAIAHSVIDNSANAAPLPRQVDALLAKATR